MESSLFLIPDLHKQTSRSPHSGTMLALSLLMFGMGAVLTVPPYFYDELDEDLASFEYYKATMDEQDYRNGSRSASAIACGECAPELCPHTQGCRAGLVRDPCGCCWDCGNLEGQSCDVEGSRGYYGVCGEKLECRVDATHAGDEALEAQCVCVEQTPLCGTDAQTYSNICKFNEAKFAQPGLNYSEGPCRTVPIIKVPPRNQVNETGSSAVFLCEVFAFPMALVEWRKDGNDVILPGDDPHISVQSRGGPQKYELSSWLQIEDASRADSGTYRCTARNELGDVSATADLGVLPPDEMSAYLQENVRELMRYDQMRYYDEDYY